MDDEYFEEMEHTIENGKKMIEIIGHLVRRVRQLDEENKQLKSMHNPSSYTVIAQPNTLPIQTKNNSLTGSNERQGNPVPFSIESRHKSLACSKETQDNPVPFSIESRHKSLTCGNESDGNPAPYSIESKHNSLTCSSENQYKPEPYSIQSRCNSLACSNENQDKPATFSIESRRHFIIDSIESQQMPEHYSIQSRCNSLAYHKEGQPNQSRHNFGNNESQNFPLLDKLNSISYNTPKRHDLLTYSTDSKHNSLSYEIINNSNSMSTSINSKCYLDPQSKYNFSNEIVILNLAGIISQNTTTNNRKTQACAFNISLSNKKNYNSTHINIKPNIKASSTTHKIRNSVAVNISCKPITSKSQAAFQYVKNSMPIKNMIQIYTPKKPNNIRCTQCYKENSAFEINDNIPPQVCDTCYKNVVCNECQKFDKNSKIILYNQTAIHGKCMKPELYSKYGITKTIKCTACGENEAPNLMGTCNDCPIAVCSQCLSKKYIYHQNT